MRSDYSMQGRGFDLKFNTSTFDGYFALYSPPRSLISCNLFVLTFTDCRREIHDVRGAIESPNYPSFYPHNSKCEWKIVPMTGNKLYMEFSSFDMEHLDSSAPDPCQFDHLIIEERDSSDSVVRSNKYCEKMPAAFTTTNTIIVKSVSNFIMEPE